MKIDMTKIRLLCSSKEVCVYGFVDEWVNFVEADISCGPPSSCDDSMELRKASEILGCGSGRKYVATLRGDSMIDAGITENSYVVIDLDRTAEVDDIVLAEVDGEYTLKYLAKSSSGNYWFKPGNAKYKPIRVNPETCFIRGVATKIINDVTPPKRSAQCLIEELECMEDNAMPCVHVAPDLPEWASTRRARALLDIAVEERLLNKSYQPLDDVSLWMLGGLAERIGDVLGLENKWVCFADFWRRNKESLRTKWAEGRDLNKGAQFRRKVLARMK